MNNTDLVRKLIREFLLLENFEEDINKEYRVWRNKFEDDVKLIRVKEYRDILQQNLPPNDYAGYDNWLNQKADLYSGRTINDIIDILNGRVVRFINPNYVKNHDSKDQLNNIPPVIKTSLYITDINERARLKAEAKYGEALVAAILNQINSNFIAKKTQGDFDSYDIETAVGKFEVKSFGKENNEIMAGASSAKYAIKCRDLLVDAIDEIKTFTNMVNNQKNITPRNQKFYQIKSELLEKIQEIESDRPDRNSKLSTYQHIKKGNLPSPESPEKISRFKLVKDLILKADELKLLLAGPDLRGNNNERLKIDDKAISINTPQLKYAFYKTIKYFNSLGVNIEVNENDIDYINSTYDPNILSKLEAAEKEAQVPRNSFLPDLVGLFIIKDIESDDPTILYIPEQSINNKLKYSRITNRNQSLRIKFTLI
jgi:hypothetical protein